MSNIFVSHSSVDKPFVKRLAAGLLAEGLPVWLDAWNLELGDSLLTKIYDGIDESSIVVLVGSRASTESGWVERELNAALVKETQLKRKFLVPVKVDECELPLKVADRLYADFSKSFSQPLRTLSDALAANGCRSIPVPASRELVPVSFTREVNVDTNSIERSLSWIRRRQGKVALAKNNIVVIDDAQYISLLQELHQRLDGISDDPYYSDTLERQLRYILDDIYDLENKLRDGVSLLLNNDVGSEAVSWFSKIIRGRAVYRLWQSQTPGPDVASYGQAQSNARLGSNIDAAAFFGGRVRPVDMWATENESRYPYFHFWLGVEEMSHMLNDDGAYMGPGRYYDVCIGSQTGKYVYPQMLIEYLYNSEKTGPPIWDLGRASIGIS